MVPKKVNRILITQTVNYQFKKLLIGIPLAAVIITYSLVAGNETNQKNKNMNTLKIGDSIPEFFLPDQDGKIFDLYALKGNKKLVIYFYPKDDSPGCTKEACYFRDQFEVFKEADAVVIGISGQSVESHKKFAEKHRLTFTLLSDTGNKIRKLFGVPTNAFGLLPGRVTYVADREGKVVYIFNSQSQAERHVDEAIKILKELK